MARLFILLACVDATRLPAEGSALLQSTHLELGRRSHVRDQALEQAPSKQGRQLVAGFFIRAVLDQEKILTLLEEPIEDPDANRFLQLACGLIVCVFVCALLALSGSDLRPKEVEPAAPFPASSPEGLRLQSLSRGEVLATADPVVPPTAVVDHTSSRLGESLVRGRTRSQHLCQGLVVPGGSECVLAVRLPPGAWEEAQAEVMDLTGQAVLLATLRRQPKALSREPAVVLRPTSTQQATSQVLARCYASRGADGEIGMDVVKGTGEIYGRLDRDPTRPRYVLSKKGDQVPPPVPFVFDGLFKEHAVLVSDGVHAEPAADAEPCTMSFDPEGSYYRLRVSSNVDVGLMICCLLSIDELVWLGA